MRPLILSFVIGAGCGCLALYLLKLPDAAAGPAPAAAKEIAQTNFELEALKQEVKRLKSELAAKNSPPADEAVAATDEKKTDFNKLLNDAKPFIKNLTKAFEPQRKERIAEMIESQVKRMTELAGLTPEQAAAFKSYLEQLDSKNLEAWNGQLNGEMRLDQLMTMGRMNNPQKAIDEWTKTNLTPAQTAAYEPKRLAEKATQITESANNQLDRMNRDLNLDESQKDKLFQTLVRTDRNYDPSLKIEGLNETADTGQPEQSRDEAITAILTPEQREKYEKQNQTRRGRRGDFMKALGVDPTALGGGAAFGE